VVLSVLEAAVLAAMDLPRITPASTNNGIMAAPAPGATAASNNSPNVIPSTGLDAQLVEDAMKVGGGACRAAVKHQHNGVLDGLSALGFYSWLLAGRIFCASWVVGGLTGHHAMLTCPAGDRSHCGSECQRPI